MYPPLCAAGPVSIYPCLTLLSILSILARVSATASRDGGSKPQQHLRYGPANRVTPVSHRCNDTKIGLEDVLDAFDAMQKEYFTIWQGTWLSAIDWTAAVMGTHVSSTGMTISVTSRNDIPSQSEKARENLVDRTFSNVVSFYFGQNALGLRTQANDDMLWVVLEWLDAIRLIDMHSTLHHKVDQDPNLWYGREYTESFAHRARIFWELAERGWDDELCGGGITWNNHLAPYKNAITNQLFIAASVGMYLYFPGDAIDSPFVESIVEDSCRGHQPVLYWMSEKVDAVSSEGSFRDRGPPHAYDRRFLTAAVRAYDWLYSSNMTNDQGLFVDGFHITGWRGGQNSSSGTKKCDLRNEMVYTYNQGVILSGQKGLFWATGNETYLRHGHALIQNVIAATGWDLEEGKPTVLSKWQGLGRLGVMEDHCDFLGTCNQDAQTFKGIFFMHFAELCKPMPVEQNGAEKGYGAVAEQHNRACKRYMPWVEHNAKAATASKNGKGLFRMWWTAGVWTGPLPNDDDLAQQNPLAVDYRNDGVPYNDQWRVGHRDHEAEPTLNAETSLCQNEVTNPDRNSVEIQSGGLSVLRATLSSSFDF